VQKVTTERNIKASDKLVYKSEKEAYQEALEQIEKAKQELSEINNISTVYESSCRKRTRPKPRASIGEL